MDTQPSLGYTTRRDAWQHAQALAPNPLASPPALRVGIFPHSTRLEDGGALTSLMIARAIGTTVEQVGLGSIAAASDPICSHNLVVPRVLILPHSIKAAFVAVKLTTLAHA